MSQLQTQFKQQVVPALKEKFGYKSVAQVPALKSVTVNVGYGRHNKDKAYIDNVENTLRRITGQKPVHNLARKSISNFKIREKADIGMSVTLRGEMMYEFLYRFVHLVLPRVRDFRGISKKAFDRQGNYSLGIKESIAFPEVNVDTSEKIHGLQVVITTSAKNKEEGLALLELLGFPFKQES
ncbi:MAG: 50S ribosomal protein L5 [Candidatus Magasanikbacteria bacterium CG11_big_fil_rev_8_21_14_0_20_39_34]|uniref:Large ribosomal subunit protein uL5 n=1 Tax=Candidatus Magasanikbacteria bacterium CG11_big_fil_rev_8_21_14_0_20_39_34 TaxID=1974653 RepID=A0A2H0N3T7_9BACT|nr:MAG: 50S ribosomal protein L5 [Candidatus Magasanikbacteria bacterium CG11_big_fil_rev_8_21_14_0_20_39_34]